MQSQQSHKTAWQRLKNQEVSCEEALKLLVDDKGIVRLELLDAELTNKFSHAFPDRKLLPPVMPLLLWRNCYYVGSAVLLSEQAISILSQQTLTDIKIIALAPQSYQDWVRVAHLS